MKGRFEELQIWKDARALTKVVYALTRRPAFATDYGLRDQIRRAAVSVLSNIAEGYERDSDVEFAHFLTIAKGSAGEVRAQLYVSLDCDYIDEASFLDTKAQAEELVRRISRFIAYLKAQGASLKARDASLKSQDAGLKSRDASLKSRDACLKSKVSEPAACDLRPADAAPRAAACDLRPADAAPRAAACDLRPAAAAPRAASCDLRPAAAAPRAASCDLRPADAAPRAAACDLRPADAAPRAAACDLRPAVCAARAARRADGFTLAEVAVAGALVAILSACVFRGMLVVREASQATAQRIAAQGACMHRYEEMKAVAFENIDATMFPATNVLLASLSKDPTRGRLMGLLSNTVTTCDDAPLRKKVDISCTWTFRGRTRTESIHGVVVDGYSTYAECGSLSGTIVLNPNLERPVLFYAKGVDGSVYTQNTLDSMPSSFHATTIVMKPGGGDRQTVTLQGAERAISNDKVVSYIAGGLDHPISVTLKKSSSTAGRTIYTIDLSCSKAAFSYK